MVQVNIRSDVYDLTSSWLQFLLVLGALAVRIVDVVFPVVAAVLSMVPPRGHLDSLLLSPATRTSPRPP